MPGSASLSLPSLPHREWDLHRTLGGRKLLLVLDLDHTLLNSTRYSEVQSIQ